MFRVLDQRRNSSLKAQSLFESLETRQLFAALVMTGTPGPDVFHINQLNATDSLTIDGGGGADVVMIGDAAHNAQNVKGFVTVNNPDGLIKIVIDDTNDTSSRTVITNPTSLGGGVLPGTVFYSGAPVTIDAGNGNNDFVLEGTGGDLTINSGTGNDVVHVNHHDTGKLTLNDAGGASNTFDVGNMFTQNIDNTPAAIQINASGGVGDLVQLSDQQSAAGHTYTFTSAGGKSVKLDRSGSLPIIINNAAITLNASGFDDSIDLSAVKQTVPGIGVNAGGGDDTILAGNGVRNSIDAGIGDDTAVVDQIDTHANIEHLKIVAPSGSISGTIFNDKNGNGKKGAGEGGLAGRIVWLDLDNDKVLDPNEPTAVTDANGKFKFTGVFAGTYKIRQKLPSGWKQTTPSNGYGINVTVAAGQSISGKLFGEKKI